MISLDQSTALLKILADPTRVRLLHLLNGQELTVAELTEITGLAQSRVSTHLAKLKEAQLIRDRRAGVSAFYSFETESLPARLLALWQATNQDLSDSLIDQDQQTLKLVLSRRGGGQSWADSVAGEMRRHYSPGRTFEATARAVLELLKLGDVIDIASGDGSLAEILASRSQSLLCLDISEKVIAAGRQRLASQTNVRFELGDMHQLPCPNESADQVLLLHALTYTDQAEQVAAETARVLRPNGQVLVSTLKSHSHSQLTAPFGHVTNGYSEKTLRNIFESAGLNVTLCEVTSREARSPQFEVITLLASKP